MNRKHFAILIAIAVAAIALAQQPPPSTDTTSAAGRYQLLAASVPANSATISATLPPNVNTVFLDTQTGGIWRHQSAFPTVNSARQPRLPVPRHAIVCLLPECPGGLEQIPSLDPQRRPVCGISGTPCALADLNLHYRFGLPHGR